MILQKHIWQLSVLIYLVPMFVFISCGGGGGNPNNVPREVTAAYNGNWTGRAISSITTSPLGNQCSGANINATISNSQLNGIFTTDWSLTVAASGFVDVSGTIIDGTISGANNGRFTGSFIGNSGSGNWFDNYGCYGTFSLTKSAPALSINADKTHAGPPLIVNFSSSLISSYGSIRSYLWDFGDGATSNEANPTHTFTSFGSYIVQCTVTDDSGLSDAKELSINVSIIYSLLGTYSNIYSLTDVVISKDNTKAYLASQDEKVYIVDISNTANPVILSTFSGGNVSVGTTPKIALSSDETRLFMVDSYCGYYILNITDPFSVTNLIYSGYTLRPNYIFGFTQGIALSNDANSLFLTCHEEIDGLQIISSTNYSTLGSYGDSDGKVNDVILSPNNDKAYVADNIGLKILDITSAQSPTVVGAYTGGLDTVSLALSDDGKTLYTIVLTPNISGYNDSTLLIFDIANQNAITQIGSYSLQGESRDIVVSVQRMEVYIANGWNGLKVIDISKPSSPVLKGDYITGGYVTSVALTSDATKALITMTSYNSGLYIIDINN